MRKKFIQLGTVAFMVSILGCAATNTGTNPLAAANQGLSAVEAAAHSGKEIINTGSQVVSESTSAATIGLVDILSHRLGVSQQQALGGAGAIFQLAQNKMAPDAFTTMARAVPGMDQMLSAAPPMSNLSSGLSSLMGDQGNALGGVAALAASFQQLDLAPDMVGQFIPIITNYVRQASGDATAGALQSVLTVR